MLAKDARVNTLASRLADLEKLVASLAQQMPTQAENGWPTAPTLSRGRSEQASHSLVNCFLISSKASGEIP